MLKMKKQCERCEGKLPQDTEAYICSYECTFCGECADHMSHVCPNCDGELLRRPTRIASITTVAASQLKKKANALFGK